MKRFLAVVGIVSITVGILFTWSYAKGVWPLIKRPPVVIGDLPESTGGKAGEPRPPSNLPLTVASGYRIDVFAKNLGAVRDLEPIERGFLASVPERGVVLALVDSNGDGQAEEPEIVLDGLRRPHGLALRCQGEVCQLFVAETDAVSQYDYDPIRRTARNRKVLTTLPSGGNHWSRSLLLAPAKFGADQLLVSIGSSCNVCREGDALRATIQSLSVSNPAAGLQPFAKGLRNAVFMAVHPESQAVWVTEMGRDLLGDNTPPDEVNVISDAGQNFGWPICYGQNIHDTSFDKNTYIRNPCMAPFEQPSTIDLPAHSAPLGLAFAGDSLYVAFHGSWNRSTPTGYKIVRYTADASGTFGTPEDFVTGWLTPNGVIGRPVDIVARDGNFYISDDRADVIYVVSRQ